MRGRFTQRYTWREIRDLYGLTGAARNLQAHYNIAPTDTIDVVRPDDGGASELVSMRWGLIPYWWKKPVKQLPATFNARAEGVASKPMFRDAFKRHRCIIPASGYYEWIARPDGKQPYFIRWWRTELRRLVGPVDEPRDRRACDVVHDHHHGRQCTDATNSRPHAGAARQSGYRVLAEWHR